MNDVEKQFVDCFNKLRSEHNLNLKESIRLIKKVNDELSKETVGSITIVSK